MVQGSLSLGIFLFPDLLGQSSWKVLADDLITMFVALVVLRNFFILQLVGQSAILSNKPLLTNFGDTTALRERVRHFHVRHFRDGEVSHFLSTQSETRILFWASPGWLAGSCSRPQIRLTQHDAEKNQCARSFTFSRNSGADWPQKSTTDGRGQPLGSPALVVSLCCVSARNFNFQINFPPNPCSTSRAANRFQPLTHCALPQALAVFCCRS